MDQKRVAAAADELKIAAITPYTSIDYPGCFSAVAFIQGCPWRLGRRAHARSCASRCDEACERNGI